MRTVDPAPGVGASRLEDFEPRYLVERAAAVIQQMELAWSEQISSEDSRCRLGLGETPNCVTGERGINVRRLLESGRYSDPLAELLVPAGEFENFGKDAFSGSADLSKRRIRIVVYTREGETNARPAVFAVVVDDENPDQFWLLARLLVTPFEISQWWDPDVETERETVQWKTRMLEAFRKSREARGHWPVDRPATCDRQQGAKASPETGTIGLEPSNSRRRVPRRSAGFPFPGRRNVGPVPPAREK